LQHATIEDAIAVWRTLRAEVDELVANASSPSEHSAASADTPTRTAVSRAPTSPQHTTLATPQVRLEEFLVTWVALFQARGDLARSTMDRYEKAIDNLSNHLLSLPVAQIRPIDVEQWMAASLQRKYSATTVNGWRSVLRSALEDARKNGLCHANAAGDAKPAKQRVCLDDDNSLTPEQLSKLLMALRLGCFELYAPALTQAMTGLRWGEVSALYLEDYDVEARVLRIRRRAILGEIVPETKTRKQRMVGVPLALAAAIRAHRAWLDMEDHAGRHSPLVYPSRRGTPLTHNRISEALALARKQAGITARFTSHGFRRSLTDLLRLAEVDPVIAAQITGHETERMRRHYSTIRASEATGAADRTAALLMPLQTRSADQEPAPSLGLDCT
ncbi:MAG: integrase family protein, partial [Myxococcaceae bacterium]|nr:integrase family protein [Myxococcaceae bacterium]